MFSDQFRRGESEKGKLSGVTGSKIVSTLSDVAWKAFQSVNQRLPEGDAIRKHRDEQLTNAGIEAAVLERGSKSAIRYRTLADEELRSSLQR